eukprot:1615818-Pyramimonas_sp.AAC.1
MQSVFVEAAQIPHNMFPVNRDLCHDQPHSSSVLVTNIRGLDLDDPTTRWRPDGSIMGPPSGGCGCPAWAKNVNVHSPSRDRNPKHCRWYDMEDYHWE